MFKKLSLLLCIFMWASHAQAQLAPQTLIVAGGCFWCVESDYEGLEGVISAESGYINGETENPTYREVAAKKTGHFEAVKITYNPSEVELSTLVEFFWRTIDPTDPNGQFCDKGSPYKTALFYQDAAQQAVFEDSKANLQANKPFSDDIVTEILAAETFYMAEEYHQDYYLKSPLRYKVYRKSCGRDKRIKQLWGEVVSQR